MRAQLPLAGDLTLVSRMTSLLVPLLGLSSVVGLTLGRRGWYDTLATTYPTFIGQDLITLVLAVPAVAFAAWKALHGSTRALLCWSGCLFYLAYSYAFYIFGVPVTLMFPVYVVIVSLGMYGAIALLFSVDHKALAARVDADMPRTTVAVFFIATSTFFAALWLAMLGTRLAAGADVEFIVRTVVALDGIVLLPLLCFGGISLLRRAPIGIALSGVLLTKAAATFLTLVINSALAVMAGQAVSIVETAAYSTGLCLAGVLLASFLAHIEEDPSCLRVPA